MTGAAISMAALLCLAMLLTVPASGGVPKTLIVEHPGDCC